MVKKVCNQYVLKGPRGGIGRHKGLKTVFENKIVGSGSRSEIHNSRNC